ncbi:MAG TPA: chlorophyllase [Leptolyngbyaceae cyanobacterium]
MASTTAVLMICSMDKITVAHSDAPLFDNVDSYTTTISANNDSADIYFPKPTDLNSHTDAYSFPITLLLQGANVDKSNYSKFASIVASYGFIVVIPNHEKSVPELNLTGLLSETSQIEAVQAQIKAENSNPASPIAGIVNTQKLALLGHSWGGAVGLSVIANLCLPILCDHGYSRPDELVAGAFFGANLRHPTTQEFVPINNSGIPIALFQGNNDSIALPERAEKTYEQIQSPPKILINVSGVNHYGITNTNNPDGAKPDANMGAIAQDVAVETVARWSGVFLRASVLNNKDAIDYIYSQGDELDKNVSVISQPPD